MSSGEHLDVVVIGAGISGIGAARYLRTELPGRSVAVLEARADIGGTWDLFRYPGIRSDSDLHTFGYEFKPWRHASAIADAPLIREYLAETVAENDLGRLIRFGHEVLSASWSSEAARWTLRVRVTAAGDPAPGDPAPGGPAPGGPAPHGTAAREVVLTANWVFAATGYYRFDEGYTPHFEGREDFGGEVVHPQHWPEGLDYAGKRVVVIGSGATAVTIVPAMATGPGAAAHVTMLQRTPTYIMSMPRVDGVAVRLSMLFGAERGYALTRFKNIWLGHLVVKGLRRFPRAGRRLIRRVNASALPAGFDLDTHFTPPYEPWDQRLCLAPDGDFFAAVSSGAAGVVTDTIDRFTERGIRLASGRELEADVVVTATGLNLRLFGGIELEVDGTPVVPRDTVAYRGMLLSGLPNWAMAIGYTTSSWTLKVGLSCRYFVDLLRHMDAHGYDTAVGVAEPGMPTRPVLDLQSGYARRAADDLPRQGTAAPWRMAMSYREDAKALRGPVAGPGLRFGTGAARQVTGSPTERAALDERH